MSTKTTKRKKPGKPIGEGKKPEYKFEGNKGTRVRKSEFLNQLTTSMFNIKFACQQIGITRRTFYRWKENDPVFEEACEEIDEGIKDEAEVMLQNHITKKSVVALIFYLKTKCKDRGYIERRESVHEGKIETNHLIPGKIIIESPNNEEENKLEGNKPISHPDKKESEDVPESKVPEQKEINSAPRDSSGPRWPGQ